MPAVIIPEPPDTTFDPTDWKELMEVSQPGGGDVISTERSEGFLVGHIPFKKKRDACKKILGYSYADPGSPYDLHRVIPWWHPAMPWLWATSVRFTGDTPVRNDDDPDGQGYPKIEGANPAYDLTAYGNYNRAVAGVGFSQLPYYVAGDDDPDWTFEYDRYFVMWEEIEPTLDTINAATGEVLWAEGPASGAVVTQNISEYRVVTRYTARWVQVPEDYLFSNGQASKIQARVGTVNSNTMFGFPADTLLFQPPQYKRYAQPVWTATGDGLWAYDVRLTWLHFDPTPAAASPLRRGWQLLPYTPGKSGVNGAAWYTARRSVGSTVYLWPSADHSTIFDHVLKP